MALAFTRDEYRRRATKVRRQMENRGIDVLLVSDIANQFWLTGCEGWSFYLPQFVILPLADEEPMWIGRAMDVPGARRTGYMSPDRVHPFPESHVQRPDRHPCDFIGNFLGDLGYSGKRIGYESDAYYFSPRGFRSLQAALPKAVFVDCDVMVNWERAVKTEAEIAYMRRAAATAARCMHTAYELIAPGVRQCDVVGEIYKLQMAGDPELSGDLTGLCPIILAGEAGTTAHPIWSEERFASDQPVAIEVAGACRRYHAALCRSLYLGRPPAPVTDTATAVEEGLARVLEAVQAGVTAAQVHGAWQAVLDRHGMKKDSRIGYSIGVGYPPDWGEHTISLRPGEDVVLESGMVLHIVIGMWLERFGLELSETVLVGEKRAECLTDFPRELHVKALA